MIYNKEILVLSGVNLADMFCYNNLNKKLRYNKTIDINTTLPCTQCSCNPSKVDRNPLSTCTICIYCYKFCLAGRKYLVKIQ